MHAYCTRANPNMVVLDLTFDQYRIKKKHLKFCVKVEDRSGFIVNPFRDQKLKEYKLKGMQISIINICYKESIKIKSNWRVLHHHRIFPVVLNLHLGQKKSNNSGENKNST